MRSPGHGACCGGRGACCGGRHMFLPCVHPRVALGFAQQKLPLPLQAAKGPAWPFGHVAGEQHLFTCWRLSSRTP